MPKVPYPYEVNGKLVTGNGSLIPICSLSNRSLLPSLTVLETLKNKISHFLNSNTCFCLRLYVSQFQVFVPLNPFLKPKFIHSTAGHAIFFLIFKINYFVVNLWAIFGRQMIFVYIDNDWYWLLSFPLRFVKLEKL